MTSFYDISYFRQLHQYIEWQTGRIRELEVKVEAISRQIEMLQQQKSIQVDKIEYHFDQLKIEKLEGTMSIGLSPAGLGDQSIEDLTANGKVIQTHTGRSESFERIQKKVYVYLESDCPEELEQLELKHGKPLQEELRQRMIGDLRRQADDRIEQYMNRMLTDPFMMLTPEQEGEIAALVVRDIRAGIEQYMTHSDKKGEQS